MSTKHTASKPRLFRPATAKNVQLPHMLAKVSAGFPSPADDFVEDTLDLNDLLITNKPATYLIRVSGDSMQGAGIFNNDILIVDASLKPSHNKIVVASVDGEFLVKRFCLEKGKAYLHAENPAYKPIAINPDDEFSIVGVVTGVVRQVT